jgi:molybdate transport system substrate-binding protein
VADLKVMSAGAVKSMVAALGAEFERAKGIKIDFNFGTAGALRDRIEQGETVDLVVIAQAGIGKLAKLALVDAGSVRDIALTVTGIIVRDGAAAPDISTPETFIKALRDTPSFAYTDPKAGGSGGIMFAGLLEKLGLTEIVNAKAVLCKGGADVSAKVAEGRAVLGTTFISEALPVKGVRVVGPLPGDLHNTNTYSAAVHAKSANRELAMALLAALTDPATKPRWTAAGLEPAF